MSFSSKATLNPNAAEFVPFAFQSSIGSNNVVDATVKTQACDTLGKIVLDNSETFVSNNTDEEAHQYWCNQLPDDITPDFNVMEGKEPQGLESLSLSEFPTSMGSRYISKDHKDLLNDYGFSENTGYSVSPFGEDLSSASFLDSQYKPWDKHVNNDQVFSQIQEIHAYNGDSRHGFLNDTMNHAILENSNMNALEYLAAQFPGFAAESLADVYITNGCDLSLTIEMLTQLELQVDMSFNHNVNSKTVSAPDLNTMDFPALPIPDVHNSLQQSFNPHRSSDKDNLLSFKTSSSSPYRSSIDFASVVKNPLPSTSIWKDDRSYSSNSRFGASRSSCVLTNSYNSVNGRCLNGDKLSHNSARPAPIWLETGEAVGNMYSKLREEARDHARIRNIYFEQARQAYLIGNKALAKELSIKGQLHNTHMKDAHLKAQESIFRQRNPTGIDAQGGRRENERMIDLHGLHVSEAIQVLKQKLSVMRSMAGSSDQGLQVYICVGTGHHTRGTRTPARLPIAVQHYLLEEGLDYTEPQPGLLRVVVY